MLLLHKVKAVALQFAILVSLIIAILLGSFLTLTQTHWHFKEQSNRFLQIIEASKQGIGYSLNQNTQIPDSTSLLLNETEVGIKKDVWGGFIKIKSRAQDEKREFTTIGLTGTAMNDKPLAIWVTDQRTSLQLVGNTRIYGDALVTNMGIKAGIISGNAYNGKELVYGTITSKSSQLPKLDQAWFFKNQQLLNSLPFDNQQYIGLGLINKNSFLEPVKIIYNQGAIVFSEKAIGNIIIKSNTEIIVNPFAEITDALLIAPKITLQKGFKGSVHLLADKQIIIEENTMLDYPSSLTVLDPVKDVEDIQQRGEEPIIVSKNASINGNLIYLATQEISEKQTNISVFLDEGSLINGHVYSNKNVELLGKVYGTVYTQKFIFNGYGSKYVNYIMDGEINALKLSRNFCGLPLEGKEKGISKWLY